MKILAWVFFLLFVTLIAPTPIDDDAPRVAIIPGHGGGDPGAVNADLGQIEKDWNLLEAKVLQNKLQSLGYQVLLCRKRDERLGVMAMQEIANRWNPDLTLVLHHNAKNRTARGWEVFYASEQSADLALLTAKAYVLWLDIGPHNAPIKPATRTHFRRAYNCLKHLDSPAVLLESCFIDNEADCLWLMNGGWRQITDALVEVVKHRLPIPKRRPKRPEILVKGDDDVFFFTAMDGYRYVF